MFPYERIVTDLDLAAGQVMLHCPACGACEATDRAALAGSPRIVCRNCGETWPGGSRSALRLAPPFDHSDRAGPRQGRKAIGSDRPRLAPYPENLGKAWEARIEADRVAPAPRSRRPYAACVLGAALFAALFLGGRTVAVAALPDLAGLYAAVGLPVNLAGMVIENVAAERAQSMSGAALTVRGTIRNVSGSTQPVPPLMAEVAGPAGDRALTHGFDAPAATLAAAGSVPFVLHLDKLPAAAAAVTVRFRRPAEVAPMQPEGLAAP